LDVNSLLELLPTYIHEYDEPFSDSSAFPTMAVARLARRHVTVALFWGWCRRAFFGGYHYYPMMTHLEAATRLGAPLKQGVGQILKFIPVHRVQMLTGAIQCTDAVSLFSYLRSVGKNYAPLISEDISRSTASPDHWFQEYAAAFAIDLSPPEVAMRLDAGLTLPRVVFAKSRCRNDGLFA